MFEKNVRTRKRLKMFLVTNLWEDVSQVNFILSKVQIKKVKDFSMLTSNMLEKQIETQFRTVVTNLESFILLIY